MRFSPSPSRMFDRFGGGFDAQALVGPEAPASRPVLLAVDEDAGDLREISRELHKRYGEDYRVVCERFPEAALRRLRDLEGAGEEVALVLADQWMAGMSGTDFLTRAGEISSTAKRALLVGWADRAASGPILQAMSLGRIDYYVTEPYGDHDERFHRVISEFLYDWAKDRIPKFEHIRVVGEQWSPRSFELRDLLGRNGVLHTFHSSDSREGRELLARIGHRGARLPVVVLFDGQVLLDPSNSDIADACGVNPTWDKSSFDLVIVGAGPAGLAAAVYAASEGLDTLIVEGEAVGGQAGTSALIRNYLGFPSGVGGAELASRAAEQAWLLGATFLFMRRVTGLRRDGNEIVVNLSCGQDVTAKSVIIATGASYRRLGVPNLEALSGSGVFYGVAVSEARAMRGQEVYVVGAGNSAGQAALHLAKYASRVTLVARGESLETSMSRYLIREIEAAQNVAVRLGTRVVDGGGRGRLENLVLEDTASGVTERVPAAGLFVLIGAEPHSGWLPGEIMRDENGYVVTGKDFSRYGLSHRGWHVERPPLPMETSMPGVFATGDVRRGAVKRVASAVGEGSIAIQTVHEYLSLMGAERSPMQTAGHTTETQASEDREMSIAAG
jgi:thioredoxin reductase (NADPH)